MKRSLIRSLEKRIAEGINIDRTAVYSALRGLRQCLGEFSELDYMIRVYREDFHPDPRHPVDYSILLHEWVHYLQFLATPVGRFISYIRRTLLQMGIDLIRQCPQPLYVPVLRWLEQQPKIIDDIPGLGGILAIVLLLQRQWNQWVGFHGASWDRKLSSLASKMPKISVEYLRNYKPIELDLDKGAFLFNFPDGYQEIFEVRELQVLEFMARALEIDSACSNGYWEDLHDYIDIWDFRSFDYHAPILYLIQNGMLSESLGSNWIERGASLYPVLIYQNGHRFSALIMLIVACQIALMDSIYISNALEPASDTVKWEYEELPGTTVRVPSSYLPVGLPAEFTGFPGKTFMRLLHKLGNGEHFQLLQLLHKGFVEEDWTAVADDLCSMTGAPKYSEMRRLALEAVQNEWAGLSGQKYPLSIERFGPVLKAEYEAAILAHELLLKRVDVTGYPLRLVKELPFPIVCMYMPGKLGLGQAPLLLGESISQILRPEPALFFWIWNHLIEKLLYDSDLGCFWEDDPSDTLWHCPELNRCSERLKQLKSGSTKPRGIDGLLGHCTNSMYREGIAQVLNRLGVTDVQPFEA